MNKWEHYHKKATPVKSLTEVFAKENDLDPVMVDKVVSAYYDNLNDAIRTLKYPVIIIPFLGRLKLSRAKTQNALDRVKLFLSQKHDDTVEFKIRQVRLNQTRLITLEKGLKKIDENNERSKTAYIERMEKSKKNS